MPRIDPYAQKRNTPPAETREFTDPSAPGQVLTLTLQAQGNEDAYLAADESIRCIETYVTKEEPFSAVGQKAVRVSESLIRSAANIAVMQRQNPDETADEFAANKYSTEDVIALSVAWETAWSEIVAFSRELNEAYEKQRKNVSRAGQNSTSDLPSTN